MQQVSTDEQVARNKESEETQEKIQATAAAVGQVVENFEADGIVNTTASPTTPVPADGNVTVSPTPAPVVVTTEPTAWE